MKRFLFCLVILPSLLPLFLKAQWNELNSGTSWPLRSITFTNDSIGYIVGGLAWSTGIILKTTDRGITWSQTIVTKSLNKVFFPSPDTGYAVGDKNALMKTNNGGLSWVYLNSGLTNMHDLKSVHFVTNYKGFVSVANGPSIAFLKTIDGGQTWFDDPDNMTGSWVVNFPSDSVGYLFSNQYKTSDGGMTWSPFSTPLNTWYYSSCFLNDSSGFAVGQGAGGFSCFNFGIIITTSDGGINWSSHIFDCSRTYDICFPTSDTGYVTGGMTAQPNTMILKTPDGGSNWGYSQIDTSFHFDLYGISCTDANTCYAVGDSGKILKTTNGGGTLIGLGVNDINESKTQIYVYPNPASTTLTIEIPATFSKHSASFAIFDYLGQNILSRQNVDETSKIEVDVSCLPHGVYFVSVFFDEVLLSGKFIINK